MKNRLALFVFLLIVLVSLTMHYRHFPKELIGMHVWRQTQTQSTIINFYEEDMNILNPAKNDRGVGDGVFRMEFPLMQWLVAGIYKLIGNHLIIARIFMFITGLLSVAGIYKLLQAIFRNETIALTGAWAFNFSPSFYYHTINPMPDNFALCCSIWGIALFFLWYRNQKSSLLILSGALLSVGALCKLPFILYFLVPLTFFMLQIYKGGFSKELAANVLKSFISILFPLCWYIYVIPQWYGNGIVSGVLDNEVPFITILDYLQHNLVSNLPELLLNYGSVMFFVSGFYFLFKNKSFRHPLFLVFLVWSLGILAYFLFEINMIAKVHDYYLFPFYPLLFILVGYGAYNLLKLENRFLKNLAIVLLMILPLTAFLRMQTRWNPYSPGFNKDLLTYKNELRDAVPKDALCVAGNDESHFIFFYYIDKKGWGIDHDKLNAKDLKMMIDKGAAYLYSDSRIIDTNPEILAMLDELVAEKGSVRVYRLKNSENTP